jgi:hypothetical protein
LFEARTLKLVIEKWVNAQDQCPTRKQTVKHFPKAPQRVIRALVQARKARDLLAESEDAP